jgi:hypothetical protein
MVESPRRVGSLSYGQGGRLARLYKQIIILAVLPLAHLQTLHMNMRNIFHIAPEALWCLLCIGTGQTSQCLGSFISWRKLSSRTTV